MNDDAEGGRDTGPKGELEYWRNRMQRLTSITEQLKRKVPCLYYLPKPVQCFVLSQEGNREKTAIVRSVASITMF